MSLPGVWAVPGVGRGKGGSLVRPGPHGSLWEGCGTPSSDGPSFGVSFQGAHMGLDLSCIRREQEIQTTGISSPWKGWLASAWSVAHLKCPGLQAFLIQRTEFSRLLNHLGQRQKQKQGPSAPSLQFPKALPIQDLIVASQGTGRIGMCSTPAGTEALSREMTCPRSHN